MLNDKNDGSRNNRDCGKMNRNLVDRDEERVIVNGVQSPWVALINDAPQGSVLGPLLFLTCKRYR